jgi:hypothetical protein
MRKMNRFGTRMAVVALIGTMAPVVVGVGTAHAAQACSWIQFGDPDSDTSAPYALHVQSEVLLDPTGEVCSNSFRTVATLTSSNVNGAGGTLTAKLIANTTTTGSTSVPPGVKSTWRAVASGVSSVHCVISSATFRSMSAVTPTNCI